MRIAIIILICILYAPRINSQVLSDKENIIVVKDPKKINMPKISDADFCQKLRAINIPDSISFIDDGRKAFYFILFNITFSKKGDILKIKPQGNIKMIGSVVDQLLQLLKTTNWRISTTEKQLEIEFRCIIEEKKIRKVYLVTTNNFQQELLCK